MKQLFDLLSKGIVFFIIISIGIIIGNIEAEWVWESIKWITIGLLAILMGLIYLLDYLNKKEAKVSKSNVFERLVFIVNESSIFCKLIILVLLVLGNVLSVFFLYNTISIVDSFNLIFPVEVLFIYVLFFIFIVLYFTAYLFYYLYALILGYKVNRNITMEEVNENLLSFVKVKKIKLPRIFASNEGFGESKVQNTYPILYAALQQPYHIPLSTPLLLYK